jgi:hypothetical protein
MMAGRRGSNEEDKKEERRFRARDDENGTERRWN